MQINEGDQLIVIYINYTPKNGFCFGTEQYTVQTFSVASMGLDPVCGLNNETGELKWLYGAFDSNGLYISNLFGRALILKPTEEKIRYAKSSLISSYLYKVNRCTRRKWIKPYFSKFLRKF